MVKVCILDYDSGNTKSVENIFEKLDTDYCLSNLKKDIINSTHLVLSGVGTYSTAMKKINENLPLNILSLPRIIKVIILITFTLKIFSIAFLIRIEFEF